MSYNAAANAADTAVYNFWRNDGGNIPTAPTLGLTGTVYSNISFFTLLACETNAQNRIGRKIVVKSLLVDGVFTLNSNDDEEDEVVCQLWLILDKQCNGQAAKATDIFSQPGPNGGAPGLHLGTEAALTATQMPNIANRQRFQFLKEWSWKAVPQTAATQKVSKRVKFYKRMNLPVEYGGTTGALGEIKSNNLFMMFTCCKQNGATASAYWSFCGNSRIRFNDS